MGTLASRQPGIGAALEPWLPVVLERACRDIAHTLRVSEAVLFLYDDLAGEFAAVSCSGSHANQSAVEADSSEILRRVMTQGYVIVQPQDAAQPSELARHFADESVLLVALTEPAPVGVIALSVPPDAAVDELRQQAAELGQTYAAQILAARPDIDHHCLFRRILDVDPGAIAVVEGREHVFSYASPTFRQVFVQENVPFLGRSLGVVLAPEHAAHLTTLLDEVQRTGLPYHAPSIEIADEFGTRHYEIHLIPGDGHAEPTQSVFMILWPRTEVMMIRQALESTILKLAESQSLLRALLDHTNNGIFLVGTDLTVLYVNRRMGEFFGTDVADTIGRNKAAMVTERIKQHMVDPDGFERRLFYLYEHMDEAAVDEVEVAWPAFRILDRYSAPVYKEDGSMLGRIEVYSDVTEVRQLQRNKDEFLSLVSHELRTPVTSIKGYAQLLQRRAQREQLPETTRTAYSTIERQSTRMQELIDLLLDLSRLESGRLRLQMGEVILTDLVERMAQMVQMTTDIHTITVQIPARPIVIAGDDRRLEQVVMNLLTNAVRYSPGGGPITVTVGQNGAEATVAVTDCGIGVAPDARERIFERFYRAADVPQSTGMGIGLYVSRGIVEQHGGSIDLESLAGVGSTFTIRLPIEPESDSRQ